MEIVDPSSSVARLPSLLPVSLGIFWIFQTTVWWGKKSMILYNILFSMVLKLSGTEPASNRPLVYPARLSRGSHFLKYLIGRVSSEVLKRLLENT